MEVCECAPACMYACVCMGGGGERCACMCVCVSMHVCVCVCVCVNSVCVCNYQSYCLARTGELLYYDCLEHPVEMRSEMFHTAKGSPKKWCALSSGCSFHRDFSMLKMQDVTCFICFTTMDM